MAAIGCRFELSAILPRTVAESRSLPKITILDRPKLPPKIESNGLTRSPFLQERLNYRLADIESAEFQANRLNLRRDFSRTKPLAARSVAPFEKILQSNLAMLRSLIVIGCALASLTSIDPLMARGQTTDDTTATEQENVETTKQRNSRPPDNPELDLFYLRTPDGNLVPVPDMSFEDFSRLYKLDKKLTSLNQLPDFELQVLRLTGEARQTVAHFKAALTIRQLADGPIRVPLGLNEVVITDETQLRRRTQAIQFDPEKDGYVIWFTGSKNGSHTLNFEFDAPIAREAKQSVLRLNLPAATTSDIQLQVPGTQIQARTQDEKRTVTVRPNPDGSLLAVRGASSRLALEWSDREYQTKAQESVVIDAQGFHHVRFRGPGLATTESRFRFVSRGGTLNSVSLRLPAGARLTNDVQNAEYEVTNDPSSDTRQRLLNIRFLEPDEGPRDVVFTTEHTTVNISNGSPETASLETLGYEVIDAVRHFGRVTLATDDTWLLRWQESANVRRVGHDPAKDGEDTVAAFEYFQQPAALPVSVLRKATRIMAEPKVKLSVLADKLTMHLSLDVRVGGAPASFLRIVMPGWQISDVAASNEVSQDEIRLDQNNPLVIPFRQPFTGDLNLQVTARRPLPEDVSQQGRFSLRLPFLLEAINSPINLQLVSPSNMIVIPTGESAEIVADVISVEPSSNRRIDETASYVFRGNPASDPLVCSLVTRPQSVQGELNGQIRIEGGIAATRMRMSASVLYEAIDSLRFQFKKDAPDDITVRLDGQRIDPRFHSWAREPADESATLILQMPKPILGALEVELDYDTPVTSGVDSTEFISAVPLPRASIGEVKDGQMTVVTAPGLVSKLNDPAWEQRATEPNRVVATAERWPAELSVTVKVQPGTTAAQTHTIERVFWQTWLTASERQDRGVFVLTTNEDTIDVQLPRQLKLDGLRQWSTEKSSCRCRRATQDFDLPFRLRTNAR